MTIRGIDRVDLERQRRKVRQDRHDLAGGNPIVRQPVRGSRDADARQKCLAQSMAIVGLEVARYLHANLTFGSSERPLVAGRQIAVQQTIVVLKILRSLWRSVPGKIVWG